VLDGEVEDDHVDELVDHVDRMGDDPSRQRPAPAVRAAYPEVWEAAGRVPVGFSL
jgi:hypothetical protein